MARRKGSATSTRNGLPRVVRAGGKYGNSTSNYRFQTTAEKLRRISETFGKSAKGSSVG